MTMTKNERMVLAYAAFKLQLKAAEKALEERFKAPLKDWVCELKDRVREVQGVVKIFMPRVEAHEELDSEAVATDLKAAVEAGKFSLPDLVDLVRRGKLIPVGDEDVVAQLERVGAARPGYTRTVPDGWREELRILPLAKGAYEGLSESLKQTVDLEGIIVKTADAIEQVPLQVILPAKTTNTTKPAAPKAQKPKGTVALGAKQK